MSSTWIQIVSCISIHIIAPSFAVTTGLPLGNYALPKTEKSLCADEFAEYYGVWDDENDDNKNSHSSSYYQLLSGHMNDFETRQNYCQRKYSGGDSSQNFAQWPAGNYCIIKKQGTSCPNGFQSGRLYMDTEDDRNKDGAGEPWAKWEGESKYGRSPVVKSPYGGTGLAIDFCCRQDGDVNRAIDVVKTWSNAPSEFALYPKVSTCQNINGYTSTMVWRYQDNEDDDNHNERYTSPARYSTLPFGEFDRNTKIYICYYRLNQPVNKQWRKGKAGATCDQTCNDIGLKCDSSMQSNVRSCGDISRAASAAGVRCAHHSWCFGRTDRDRAYAGAPFISAQNGFCYFLSDGAQSVCNSNAGVYHEPLCYCV